MSQVRPAVLVAVVAFVLGFLGCGPSVRPGQLRVERLSDDPWLTAGREAMSSEREAETPSAAQAPRSASEFSLAHVDGLRLTLLAVDLVHARDDDHHELDLGGPRTIELGRGASQAALDAALDVPIGSYRGVRARFDSSFEVKGYCRTATRLVYTTPAGVRALECAGCAADLPADYGYFRYAFGDVATADGPAAERDAFEEESHSEFTIPDAGAPSVALLVDTAYAVSCYDGTAPLAAASPDAVAPFSRAPRHGALTDYFPSGQPAFGLARVPLFTWVPCDPTAASPSAETYLAAGDASALTSDGKDFSRLLVTTAVIDARGGLLALRSRGLGAENDTGLAELYDRVVPTSSGVYDALNGAWWSSPDEPSAGRQLEDRKVVGFARQRDFATVFHTQLADGPDCGKTLAGDPASARPCLPGPPAPAPTVAWRRAAR